MKLFISYSSAWRDLAERLRLAIEAEGHDVFMDRTDLEAGASFHEPLREAVESADRFIFLLSPESVAPGSYALTELGIAEGRWPQPHRRVLPVLVAPTPLASIPPYLKAVTLLQPKGDVVAETVAAIARMTGSRWRWMGAAAALAAAGVVGGGLYWRQHVVENKLLQREIAAATELCQTGSHAVAWAQFAKIAARRGDDAGLRQSREDCGMLWLREMEVTGDQASFSELVAKVQQALAQGLVGVSGQRAADLRAHLGWADCLRQREGTAPDPALNFQRALADDAGNVYAHAMWAYWLMRPMTSSRELEEAELHFAAAVRGSREREFVRTMQISAALNGGVFSYPVIVADDMRQHGETPSAGMRDDLWRRVFRYQLIDLNNADDLRTFEFSTLPASAQLATFVWLFPSSKRQPDERERNEQRLCLAVLQLRAGELQAARAGLESLRDERSASGGAYRFAELTDRLLAGMAPPN